MSLSATTSKLRYSLQVSTAAAVPPLSLDYVRNALRIDTTDDDQKLRTLILAATGFLQRTLGRQFINATLVQHTDRVPDSATEWIHFRVNPVSSISSMK